MNKPNEPNSPDDEIEDLEVCCREGRQPRCDLRYRIKVDKEPHISPVSFMTGRQIWNSLANASPINGSYARSSARVSSRKLVSMKRSISPRLAWRSSSPFPATKLRADSPCAENSNFLSGT